MTKRRFSAAAALVMSVATTAMVLVASTGASLVPSSATFTLRAGTSTSEVGKQVNVPATPPSADVEIAIDTTGSMQGGINDATSEANAIVTGVQGAVANTDFAVVQFKDFCTSTSPTSGAGCTNPGDGVFAGDYPEYQVVQAMTPSAGAVSGALGTLSANGGGDAPEAYNLVFHNSVTDPSIGWRTGTRKFVIVIGDAQPHGDLATQGLGPCIDASADPHGLVTSTELAGMAAAERTLLMINETDPQNSTSLGCYQTLAAQAFSGGAAVDSGGSGLATDIITLINAAFATVNNVHLEVDAASPAPANASWITLPPALGPVAAPGTYTFGPIGIAVPGGTPAGTYSFDLVAKADGIDIGHETITVIVPQKMLTLTPATSTNPIGASHTVTAQVFDSLGPYVGDTVNFSVAGGPVAVPSSGSGTTDGSGNATFTFSNTPPNPGTNTITATDGSLSATASKTWNNSPPVCSGVTANITTLWPPNHKLWTITVSGATDSDIGDSATLVVDGITQDELVNGLGDGDTSPDGFLSSPLTNTAQVRAERSGLGDGRVYRLHFTATDTHGATCTGFVTVGVPHDQGAGSVPIDSAPPSYNSLLP
jgi:hypothetical protein